MIEGKIGKLGFIKLIYLWQKITINRAKKINNKQKKSIYILKQRQMVKIPIVQRDFINEREKFSNNFVKKVAWRYEQRI